MPQPIYCSLIAQEADEPLIGTASQSVCHFVMSAPKNSWTAKIEAMDGAVGAFAKLIDPYKDQAKFTLKHGDPSEAGKLWLFPHGYRFDHLPAEQYGMLIEQALNGDIKLPYIEEASDQHWVLVCTHGKRDACCAKWGSPTLQALRAGAPENVNVWESSHLGGHRFAGTLVVQPASHWYGWVTPIDAPELLQHITEGKAMPRLYRGNAHYPPPLQAAEAWAWQHLAESNLAGRIELINPHIDGQHATVEVSIAHDGLSETYKLSLHGEPYTFLANTDSAETKDRLIWRVTGTQRYGQDY